MNAKDALKLSIGMGRMVCMSYLDDLTDDELLRRPCEGCNHINWQVGHLVASEHALIEKAVPGSMPPLPEGFEERYSRETASVDDPGAFCNKAELLAAFEAQRAGTLQALEQVAESDLDRETGIEYAPTVAALFEMQGSHWLMHAGQWAVVRRQLGRPPLF